MISKTKSGNEQTEYLNEQAVGFIDYSKKIKRQAGGSLPNSWRELI